MRLCLQAGWLTHREPHHLPSLQTVNLLPSNDTSCRSLPINSAHPQHSFASQAMLSSNLAGRVTLASATLCYCCAEQKFDMDPKTFTLGKMFAMQLHKFAADISVICSAATKELTIEQELKKLSDVWKEQKFDLFKYSKGMSDDKGWVLRGERQASCL